MNKVTAFKAIYTRAGGRAKVKILLSFREQMDRTEAIRDLSIAESCPMSFIDIKILRPFKKQK
jgi:hypothetical protein